MKDDRETLNTHIYFEGRDYPQEKHQKKRYTTMFAIIGSSTHAPVAKTTTTSSSSSSSSLARRRRVPAGGAPLERPGRAGRRAAAAGGPLQRRREGDLPREATRGASHRAPIRVSVATPQHRPLVLPRLDCRQPRLGWSRFAH